MIFVSDNNVTTSDVSVALSSETYFTRHVSNRKTATYDLCNELFSLFLDETMSYSGAVFKNADGDLNIVQLRKSSLVVEKSKFSMAYHIVEIGFGRGSLSMEHDKKPCYPNTDINLTVQQLKFWDLGDYIRWPNKGRVLADHNYDCGHFLLVCPYDKIGAFSYLKDVCTTAALFKRGDFDATEISTNIEEPTIFKEFWIGLDKLNAILKVVPVNFPDLAISLMKSGVISSTSHGNRYLVAKYSKESSKQLATWLIYLGEKQFAAEEISFKVLTETKEIRACRGLAMRTDMITVLAYFIASKYKTTKVAGIITVGFNVMSIITEGTVAAIAYGLDKNASKDKVGLSGVQESLLIAAANAYSQQVILELVCGSKVHISFAEAIDDALVHKFLLANEPCFITTYLSGFHSKGELFSSIGSTDFFKYLEKYTGPDIVKEWRKLLGTILSMLGGVMTLPPLPIQVTYGVYIASCCVEGELLKATVLHDEMVVQGIKSHVVIYTNLVHKICNEYKLLEVGFVLGAGRIWLKLVEKVAALRSTSRIAKNLQVPMPSTNNALEELDPTINNVLKSKLHKVFNVGPSALPSSSPKKLVGVNRVGDGCILWFEKQKKSSSLEVALGNAAFEEFLWVVNTGKEEHDNVVVSDDNVSSIGIYGMGGVGKTTLAKHIHNRLVNEIRYQVQWVTVSQGFNIKRLQDNLAKIVNLDLSNEEDEHRTAKLNREFRKRKHCYHIG
ncbi:hypothetical protein K7X08_021900 [Anisodus acutangulus]|uniref:NB-ARC domain-containing protein n=1 Tax=Anisodus acutangulus TaxID=402998 RepID=A0A9Q1QUS3_9SOLA|nr:hypothetical protein K7X08_021900 [Anisodus acutangulus]